MSERWRGDVRAVVDVRYGEPRGGKGWMRWATGGKEVPMKRRGTTNMTAAVSECTIVRRHPRSKWWIVMCLAWLEARKPESQSLGFVSQAKPNSGLDGGLGSGLRLATKNTPLVFQTVFLLNLWPDGVLVSLENCLKHPTQAKPSQALPAGLGSGLTDFKPKPAQAKPKPWFQSQAKPEHH
ncbi:hypothetical protein DFH08DRAFT_825243 [Mycena albidolilacea]|uniref:Uncharacterized protein n=1 Tax=Mycena albidolilacea TaxID=1033008 RepID=A0AAD6Z3I8_9AGAR|nr:hypothetical protein DFH08DRAFT_825243 [Mycena albidolilacea]